MIQALKLATSLYFSSLNTWLNKFAYKVSNVSWSVDDAGHANKLFKIHRKHWSSIFQTIIIPRTHAKLFHAMCELFHFLRKIWIFLRRLFEALAKFAGLWAENLIKISCELLNCLFFSSKIWQKWFSFYYHLFCFFIRVC